MFSYKIQDLTSTGYVARFLVPDMISFLLSRPEVQLKIGWVLPRCEHNYYTFCGILCYSVIWLISITAA